MNQSLEFHIKLDKELRRDIDIIIQRLKFSSDVKRERVSNEDDPRESAERSTSILKLQEAVMWLGMDLKAINDENPTSSEPKTVRQCAEEAYARYGAVTDFKNFRGEPMPEFANLGEKIQAAWEAAVSVPTGTANPYPNSKDPSNTKIDPTADGLKL